MQLLQNLWLSGERYISRSNWQAKPYQIFMVQNALPPPKKNGRPVVSRTPQTCLSPAPTKSRHTLIYCSMLMKYRE